MSFHTGGTCVQAWKRRDGLGGRISKQKWEQRWIVLADGKILYYGIGDEDRFGEPDLLPRGSIDLKTTQCRVEVSSHPSVDAPTPNEVEIISEEIIQPATRAEKPRKPLVTKWRLCFDSQLALIEFLDKAHTMLQINGQLEEKDSERFEHEFHPADHIYRWEMIVCPPVIYPIQIHGIVLEGKSVLALVMHFFPVINLFFPSLSAGRNCVVVADFGLTGYGKKSTKDVFHHASQADKEQHNAIVAAFKKLRPNSDQRLHITTLTDPIDIRKWHKAHYDEQSFQCPDALKKLSKLLNRVKLVNSRLREDFATNSNNNSSCDSSLHSDNSESSHDDNPDAASNLTRQKALSEEYSKQRQEEHPLPNADPKDIVLSRANFLLEYGEEKIPPYHVFFSNSECIAVWCKTGRWSTLQTAVFLSSNAIGGAKSATVATLGVAAAHAILAPVVAVGGLLWVSAPMVILQKSRERWEINTQLMTDLYWQWAPPKVYVCAIEHWSEVGYTTQQQQIKKEEPMEAKKDTPKIKKYSSVDILCKRPDQEQSTNHASTDIVLEIEKECKQEEQELMP